MQIEQHRCRGRVVTQPPGIEPPAAGGRVHGQPDFFEGNTVPERTGHQLARRLENRVPLHVIKRRAGRNADDNQRDEEAAKIFHVSDTSRTARWIHCSNIRRHAPECQRRKRMTLKVEIYASAAIQPPTAPHPRCGPSAVNPSPGANESMCTSGTKPPHDKASNITVGTLTSPAPRRQKLAPILSASQT